MGKSSECITSLKHMNVLLQGSNIYICKFVYPHQRCIVISIWGCSFICYNIMFVSHFTKILASVPMYTMETYMRLWSGISKPRSAQGSVFDINRKGALPYYGKNRSDGTFFPELIIYISTYRSITYRKKWVKERKRERETERAKFIQLPQNWVFFKSLLWNEDAILGR